MNKQRLYFTKAICCKIRNTVLCVFVPVCAPNMPTPYMEYGEFAVVTPWYLQGDFSARDVRDLFRLSVHFRF